MITIGKLAKLFGISEQTIRMYERYHIISTSRDPNNGYRRFDLNAFTDLIKARIFQGIGFSMKNVSFLMDNCDIKEAYALMECQKEKLHDEILELSAKSRALERMMQQIDEILKKQGTCEVVLEEGWYVQPILNQNDDIIFDARDTHLWNTFAYIRQDVNLLHAGEEEKDGICFACSEADVKRYNLDLPNARYFPPQKYLKAYFLIDAAHYTNYWDNLAFA